MKNVLMLSIDQSILREGSDAALRMKGYGKIAGELHIIVFTKKISSDAYVRLELSPNVFVYPTNTRWKMLYFFDFWRIAVRIVSPKAHSWLITSQDAFTHGIGLLLRWRLHVPLEIQIHTDFLSPYFRMESLKNYFRYVLYCIAVMKGDYIRVVSERIRESLQRVSGTQDSRIYVLPVFVDIKKIQHIQQSIDLHKKYPQYDFIFLIASRLTKEKNIPMALSAFSSVAKLYPRSLLLIVGDGPEKQSIELKIKDTELSQNVIIEPVVSFDTLISYYKTADIFVLTSDYEGYGRTLVEALASGTPVITTDVGIVGEIITNGVTGVCVDPQGADDLKNAMADSIQDYKKFQAFAERGRSLIVTKGMNEEEHIKILKSAWDGV